MGRAVVVQRWNLFKEGQLSLPDDVCQHLTNQNIAREEILFQDRRVFPREFSANLNIGVPRCHEIRKKQVKFPVFPHIERVENILEFE